MMKNIFDAKVTDEIAARINTLKPDTAPQWGKMNAAQMLAHCNVTYELVYDNHHAKPSGVMKWMLKLFVKNTVVTEKPYARNSRTGPVFLITDEKIFDAEKSRLLTYISRTQQLGASHFEGKESHSFGALTSVEWNNMFYKHLDHHLSQFGV